MAITFTNNLDLKLNRITNVGAPALSSDAVTKQYVDNVAAGLNWKDAVRVAATTNVITGTPGTTIDGVTLQAGDRVLLMGQTNPIENGIYTFDGSALARADDANGTDPNGVSELRPGTAVTVSEGTTSGNHTFVVTTDGAISIGTDPITWSLLNAGTAPVYTGGDGVDITNNNVSAVSGNAGITVSAGGIGLTADPDGGLQVTPLKGVGAHLSSTPDSGLFVDSAGLRFRPRSALSALAVDSTGVAVAVNANRGLTIDAGGLNTVLATDKGLQVDVSGLAVKTGNGVATDTTGVVAVADLVGGLQVGGSGIAVRFGVNPGLVADSAGLVVKPDPVGGLTTTADGAAILPKPDSGIATDNQGAYVKLRLNDGLDVDSGGVGINTAANGGLQTGVGGLTIQPKADMGLALASDGTGLYTVLDSNGGLRVDNVGVKVLADPAVLSDPAEPSLIVGANGVGVNTALFPRKYAASVGDGIALTYTVTHNLNTQDVQVEVYEVSSGQTVYADVSRTDSNTVSVGFSTPPSSGQYRVVVVG
jgi:hypothetical protein